SQDIELDMARGALASAPALAVLNGANRMAVLASNGLWEIIAFREAAEISAGRWRLRGLLRALSGTDDAMRAGLATGAPAVLLDRAVRATGLAPCEAGLPLSWVGEPLGGMPGRVGPIAFAGGVRAETPRSPVHLRAQRGSDGAVVLSWTRRGRIDSDSWSAVD